jgi:hypothetical protein
MTSRTKIARRGSGLLAGVEWMRIFAFVSLAALLAGCAMPQKTTTATNVSSNANPACDKHTAVTGSHLSGNCDHKNVSVMSSDAMGTAMRQHPGAGLSSQ